jgi:hypothetical protein
LLKKVKFLLIFNIFLSLIIFSSCTSSIFAKIGRNSYSERVFETLQKGELIERLEVKSIIHSVYLNHVEPEFAKKQNGEYFLISVYISNDFLDKDKQGLFNPMYKLTMNNNLKPVSIEKLSKDSKLVKKMPFQNTWSFDYLVKFEQIQEKNINLTYEHDHYGKVQLYHLKESVERLDFPKVVDTQHN